MIKKRRSSMKLKYIFYALLFYNSVGILVCSEETTTKTRGDSSKNTPNSDPINGEKKNDKNTSEGNKQSIITDKTKSFLASCCTVKTMLVAPSIIYYPVAAAGSKALELGVKLIGYGLSKKADFNVVKKRIALIDKKINKNIETVIAYGREKNEQIKNYLKKEENKSIDTSTEQAVVISLRRGCRTWLSSLLTGFLVWKLLKFTDKTLHNDRLGKISSQYKNWQDRYNAWRINMANKGLSLIVRTINKCIPDNAHISYIYSTTP